MQIPTIEEALKSQSISNWAKEILRSAAQRDPVDAASDAEFVAMILAQRSQRILGRIA